MVHVSSMCSGACPARASSLPSDVMKQPAWAAASSSSGLVLPSGSPMRDAIVTGSAVKAPELAAVIVPEPRATVPSHVASATLTIRGLMSTPQAGDDAWSRHHLDLGLGTVLLLALRVLAPAHLLQRANRDLDLVERRLARGEALEPQTGRQQHAEHAAGLVLAGEADQLVGKSGDHREEQDPTADEIRQRRPAHEREHEDADHHHP